MSNFVQVMKACEKAGGAGGQIMAAVATADPTALNLIAEALNPKRVFGVTKVDMPKDFGMAHVPRDPDFEKFFELLDKLHSQELTGHAANDAVTATLAMHDEETAAYLVRILLKDLKVGLK